MNKFTLFLFSFLILSSSLILGQRRGDVNYVTLANQASAPNFFFDSIILPPNNSERAQLVFLFRMDNSFLPFKKISIDDNIDAPEGVEFYSVARLNTELFKGKASKKELKNLSTVSRDLWQDTVFAEKYDDTKSKKKFASGRLVTDLEPGFYSYVLQLSLMEETNDRNSQRIDVEIESFPKKKTGEIYLLNSGDKPSNLELINMGNNVIYGKDYQLLIRIPNYNSEINYSLNVNKARITRKDTVNVESVKTINISREQIFENSFISLLDTDKTTLSLNERNGKYTYALIEIPNSEFENAIYNVVLKANGDETILAEKLVRSYWPDIPPSLLNLDISLEMMKYIVSDDELKRLKSGNAKEKEQKFRDFWEKRDPTPNTEFNELMTEYYRRVHYAFVEYRTPESPLGQDTDQGEIYIKYGPPNSRDRVFPKKGQVIETWKYDDRSFVFEKGGGFSEFMLIGK